MTASGSGGPRIWPRAAGSCTRDRRGSRNHAVVAGRSDCPVSAIAISSTVGATRTSARPTPDTRRAIRSLRSRHHYHQPLLGRRPISMVRPRHASGFYGSSGQAEQPLGDDVELHLRRAAVDRGGTAGQQVLGPLALRLSRGRRRRRRCRTTTPRIRRIAGRCASTTAWRWPPRAWGRRRPVSAGSSACSAPSRRALRR